MVELPATGRAATARRTAPPLKPPPEPPPLEPPPEEDEEEPFLEALSLPSFLYLARSFINDKPKNKQWYDGKRREHTAGND